VELLISIHLLSSGLIVSGVSSVWAEGADSKSEIAFAEQFF
jgi:hypothetical protein